MQSRKQQNYYRLAIKRIFFLLICVFTFGGTFSQERTVVEILIGQHFEKFQYDQKTADELILLRQILFHRGQKKHLDSVKLSQLSSKESIPKHLCKAFYHLYNQRNTSMSFDFFNSAYILSKQEVNTPYLKLSLIGFLELYSREMVQSNSQFKHYLNEFKSLIRTIDDEAWYLYYSNFFNSTSIFRPDAYYQTSKALIPFVEKHDLSIALKARFYEDIGLYYNRTDQTDQAKLFYQKVLSLPEVPYVRIHKFNAHLDLAEIDARTKKFEQAKQHFKRAKEYYNPSDSLRSMFTLDRFKAIYLYEKIPRYDSAYHYLKQSILKEQKIDYKTNSLKISELNVRLRTAEKEKEILQQQHQLEREQRIKASLFVGSVSLFLLVSLIVYSMYKNFKRKQHIAEQEKQLEAQKVEKVLKDQELNIINAMIEGQEKERQDLAEELHDNVASTLASAHMQLDYFIKHRDRLSYANEILEKTAALIGNAYKDIHDMAHQKNTGVIAKKGLFPALKDLARNVSIHNKIHIQIQESHIETRIPNALEITIFRIIQEAVNNIVKHSNATKAVISIHHQNNLLKIAINDNGKGLPKSREISGMGLTNIQKRVRNLRGQVKIESTPGKGTYITINIPME